MVTAEQMNIKSRTYYFYDDMINIKDFDPSLLKLYKKSFKNIGVYYIGYITKKDKYKYKYSNSTFDDYSISPKIRQILLHLGYELTESDLLKFCCFFLFIYFFFLLV